MTAASEPFTSHSADLDRSIAFQLVFNVRDLGGLPTVDGGTVRRGQVFRADGVHRLQGDDLAAARALGLKTVIDLRTDDEVGRGRFPHEEYPVAWHHLPVIRRIWSDDELVAGGSAAEFLRDRYLDMLVHGGDSIARAVELVADGAPALFHCAAGKDRTGVVAAVVLGLLDVSHDDIAADYHASAAAMASFVDWLTIEFPQALDAMTSQPPEYLEAPADAMYGFLREVDDRYGSMERLARHLGVSDEAITRAPRHPARLNPVPVGKAGTMPNAVARLWSPSEVHLTIPRSPDEVYDVIADPETYPPVVGRRAAHPSRRSGVPRARQRLRPRGGPDGRGDGRRRQRGARRPGGRSDSTSRSTPDR